MVAGALKVAGVVDLFEAAEQGADFEAELDGEAGEVGIVGGDGEGELMVGELRVERWIPSL